MSVGTTVLRKGGAMATPRLAVLVSSAAALVVTLASASDARADAITLTAMAPVTFAAEGDTVEFKPVALTLAPIGARPFTFDFQQGNLHVDLSPCSCLPPHEFEISRTVTINGVSHSVTQAAELAITPSVDTLRIFRSGPTTFDFGSRGTLFLSLEGLTQSARVFGDFPLTIRGALSATAPTPEPASLLLLMCGIAAAAAFHRGQRYVRT
jgi:hypothetical protein